MGSPRRRAGTQDVVQQRYGVLGIHPRFEPNLPDIFAIVQKQTHTVSARHNRIKPIEQHLPGKMLEDLLPDEIGGLNVECQPGHHPQRANPHHHPGEVVVAPRHVQNVALARHQFQRRHRRRQIPVPITRSMRRRRHCPTDRDVREGSHVVEGKPLAIERPGQIAIAHRRIQGDGHRIPVDLDPPIEPLHRHQLSGVGDVVE